MYYTHHQPTAGIRTTIDAPSPLLNTNGQDKQLFSSSYKSQESGYAMDPNEEATNLCNSATPQMRHNNTKPPHYNHRNPWAAMEDTEHASKEDAEGQETCR